MRSTLFAMLPRAPWLLLAFAVVVGVVLIAVLWIVTSRAYALKVLAGSTTVELTPPTKANAAPVAKRE